MRMEGHLRLMTEEFFREDLQHLLILIPKGNWKTTWQAALAVWHLLSVKAPRIYGGASDREQADELYGFASHFATCQPWIAKRLLVRDSVRTIRLANGTGLFKILASDDSRQKGKKQGKNATLTLADEPHAYENDSLWTDLRSAGFKRREAAHVAGDPLWFAIGKDASISTAGHDPDGPLGRERAKFLGNAVKGVAPIGTVESGLRTRDDGSLESHEDGRLTICRSPSGGSVMLEWACRWDPKDPAWSDDLDDPAVVKFASPAPTVTIASLVDSKELLTPAQYKRYRANVWTEGYESWLPETAWPKMFSVLVPVVVHRTWEDATWTGLLDDRKNPILEDELDEDGEVTLAAMLPEFRDYLVSLFPEGTSGIAGGLDMARYRDTAAVVAIAEFDGKRLPRAIVWRSGGHNKPIRYEWPKVAILALHTLYGFKAFGADPKWSDQMLTELELSGVPIEEVTQSNERMGQDDTELRKDILDGRFVHDGDPVLTAHVQAGAERYVGPKLIVVDQQKIAKAPPIDACKALSMANSLWKIPEDLSEPMAAWG